VVAWFWRTFATPRISGRLLRHLDETLVEDVRHHWVVYVVPVLVAVAGGWFVLLGFFVNVNAGWFCFLVGALLMLVAGWRALNHHMDRFVVTNMRVFRVRGVIAESAATMPLARCSTSRCGRRCSAASSDTATSSSSPRRRNRGCATSGSCPTPTGWT
jgi:hypothetical protein